MKANQSNTPGSSGSKSALGKGLSSLIPQGALGTLAGNEVFTYLDPKDITPNPYQPRKEFAPAALEELAASIEEQGLLQPIVVQKKASGGYELIAGERRLRASKIAQLDKIPVFIKTATDRGKLLLAIIENVQRSELNIVEEARAYTQLIEEFELSQEQVAIKVGKSRSGIANIMRVLKLPSVIVTALKEDKISFGHAKILLGLESKNDQVTYFQKIIEKNLSVRDLELLLKKDASRENDDKKHNQYDEEEKKNKWQKEMQARLKLYKDNLESKTGLHFDLSWGPKGDGKIAIKFQSKEEFQQIYDYLLKTRS